MTRLHDLVYGPLPSRSSTADQRDSSVQELVIHGPAARTLLAQLRCTGRWRSGLLFGTLSEGALSIDYVSPATAPGKRTTDDSPLAFDPDYALGWADALTTTHDGQIDWQGMWLMAPHSELQDALEQLRWVHQARQQGLLTEDMALLCVGWQEGRLRGNAYIQRDEPTGIPVRIERDSFVPMLPRTPRASE